MSKENIVNTCDQNSAAGGDRIVIFYNRQETGRVSRSAHYAVARIKEGQIFGTYADAPWYDYKKKTFSMGSIERKAGESLSDIRKRVLQDAIVWANKKYGVREFVKNRLGDYVEKEVNEKFPIPKRETTTVSSEKSKSVRCDPESATVTKNS